MSHIDKIRYEFLFEFASFQDWKDNSKSLFEPYSSDLDATICLDSAGNGLTSGEDFADAQILKTYPIKTYRLVRVSEILKRLVDDVFNEQLKNNTDAQD